MQKKLQFFNKDIQFYKFSFYGFFKNLKFFEPFFILFLLDKGLNYWQIGIIYSIREIVRNIFEIPSGFIADAMGRRKTLIMSFLIYSISFVVFYFSETYILLLVAMSIFAFADAFRTGTNKAMIFDYINKKAWNDQKVEYYGNTRSWSQKGSAVSSLIAAAIVVTFNNYTIIFLASIIPYLINAALVWSYPKCLEGEIRELNAKDILSAFKNTFKNLWFVVKKPEYWKIINLNATHTGYHKALKEYIQPLIIVAVVGLPCLSSWANERKEAVFIGIIYFFIYMLTSLASKSSWKFAKYFTSKEKALFISLMLGLIAGTLTGIFALLELTWIAIFVFVLIYLIENFRKPIGFVAVAEKSDQKVMASVLSINSQAESLFTAIIAPLLGYSIDLYGLGWGLIIISVAIILISGSLQIISKHFIKSVE